MRNKVIGFFRKWNGMVLFPFVVAVFLIANWHMKTQTGDEYPLVALVGIALAISKVFLAEFIGSILLYVNQPDYFKVIHEQDNPNVSELYKKQSWREAAFKFYALYCLVAGLGLAFA